MDGVSEISEYEDYSGYEGAAPSNGETAVYWGRDWNQATTNQLVNGIFVHCAIKLPQDGPVMDKGRIDSNNPSSQEHRQKSESLEKSRNDHLKNMAEEFGNGNFGTAARELGRAWRDEIREGQERAAGNRDAMENWLEDRR